MKILIITFSALQFFLFTNSFSQSVTFYQDNIIFSDSLLRSDTTMNSYFGRVKLTFVSSDTLKYFNLSAGGNGISDNWTIRNFPVTSLDSTGLTESRYFSFIIRDTAGSGVNVSSINYGFSLTSDTIITASLISSAATVGNFNYILNNGILDNRVSASFSDVKINVNKYSSENGFTIAGQTKPGYPVLESGFGESFPVSLSDGAMYLKLIPSFPQIEDSNITISKMKTYSTWGEKGVYLYNIGGRLNEYFTDRNVGVLSSPLLPPPSSLDLENVIIPLLNNHTSVYLLIKYTWKNPSNNIVTITNQLVSVRSLRKLNSVFTVDSSEAFELAYSNDVTQGSSGGTIVEEAVIIPSQGRIISPYTLDSLTMYGINIINQTDLGTLYLDKTDIALPVELTSFTSVINKKDVTLVWKTEREENNYGFDIERSLNNGAWIRNEFINGNGTSISPQEYFYEDKNLISGKYNYRLKQIDFNGNYKYYDLNNDVVIGIPEKFAMSQNYPNPFNPVTKINYDISLNGNVRITIYDINGKEIRTIINEFKSAGYYSIEFNAYDIPSGVYFYELQANGFTESKKLVVLK